MNFRKGKNVIVFDSRLRAGGATAPACKPPMAWQRVSQVRYLHLQTIIDTVRRAADSGGTRADTLAIFCHGAPAFLLLGLDKVHWGNIKLFGGLAGRFRNVEIYACSPAGQGENEGERSTATETTGSGTYRFPPPLRDWQLFLSMADLMGAPVRVARGLQMYTHHPRTLEIDFGPWEGTYLDIYPGGVANETETNQ